MKLSNLLGFILFLSLAQEAMGLAGGNLQIRPSMLKFKYSAFEGEAGAPCIHAIQNPASQDWSVLCKNPQTGFTRKYIVHLWVTIYTHPVNPKMSYEVLYWVRDVTVPTRPAGSSTTVWFHLNDPSALNLLQMSQSVENDTAGLYLEINPWTAALR